MTIDNEKIHQAALDFFDLCQKNDLSTTEIFVLITRLKLTVEEAINKKMQEFTN